MPYSNMSHPESPHIPAHAYRMIFDQADDAVLLLDGAGMVIEANPAATRQLGYARDELLGMDPRQFHHPDSAEEFSLRLEQVDWQENAGFEAIHVHRDGTHIPVGIQLRLLDHDHGRIILATCRPLAGEWQCAIEYEKIIQATGEGYWMVRVSDARIIDTNETFCKMVGYSREELLSMTISDLEVVESPEETAAHIRKVMETGHDMFETRHRHKDGRILDFEISVGYADIRGGVIFVFTRDISGRKRQEAAQRLSSLVVDASTATVMVTDGENRIISVNPAFTKITGYRPNEVVGYNPNLLSSGRQGKEFYEDLWATLLETGHWEGEWWNRRKDGEEYAEQVNLNLIRNPDGSVYRYVKIATDITDKKRLDDQVWQQANYDAVTNLPNRRLYLDRLRHEMKKCDRTGESLAVFYIDLDHFKDVNDQYGHTVGDMLLVDASRRIGSCIRATDTVARLGGDEFAVLLTDLADTARVEKVAQHTVHMLSQPFRLGEITTSVSGSVGIAIYPHDGIDVDELLKRADLAMYAAKRGGKNRFNYSSK